MFRMGFFYRFCRGACMLMTLVYLRLRCHWTHRVPREGGVILACNHQSFMDPVLVAIALQREAAFMARDTLFKNPVFKQLISRLNAFPVRRGTADVGAIKECLRRLKQGQVLVVFPEGTRSPDGRIRPFLAGFGAVAKKAGVPIVPTLVDGMSQSWPRHQKFPRPGNVIVQYGPPITPAEYADLSVEALMSQIQTRLETMQAELHRRMPERRLQCEDGAG